MPGLRDHEPVVIESFNGLWNRGDDESAPSDHFTQADNIQFFSSGFETRNAIDKYAATMNLRPIIRMYTYVMQNGQSILFMTDVGEIYHFIPPSTYHLVYTNSQADDFAFVAYNGRAYFSPMKTYTDAQGRKYKLGIKNVFIQVYKGDGTPSRDIGGSTPSGPLMASALGDPGNTDTGLHLFGVVYETDTGFLSAPGPEEFSVRDFPGDKKISLGFLPISPDPSVTKRHVVCTKWIPEYNNDQKGYQFFFVPGGTIPDNTTNYIENLEFFDSDLIADASHLLDNFSKIPSGVALTTYHGRLVSVGEFGSDETLANLPANVPDNRSLARLSYPGEPETFSKIDGLLIAPLDGNPLTNAQEFRDILYLFKKTRTYAYADNMDEPSTWQEEVQDQGIGTSVHGIASVLDSGGVNTDFLLVADISGLVIFNGTYARPEMSWKIEDLWLSLNREELFNVQLVNDSMNKKVWIVLPDPLRTIVLHIDYSEGMDAKNIKWARWIFDANISSIALIEMSKLLLASNSTSYAGIYFLNRAKAARHDSYYQAEMKIPDPTVRTALLGE